MKKLTCLISLLCFIALGGQAFAYSVSLASAPLSLGLGETGRVDVNLSIGPGEQLFGFNFGLGFDSSLLRFENLTFNGDRLEDYVVGYTRPSAANPSLVTFDGGLLQSGGETSTISQLASLYFTGVAAGTSPLSLTGSVLDLAGSSEVPLNADGSIGVDGSDNVVPEPATLLLSASGLAGLTALRRRRTQA